MLVIAAKKKFSPVYSQFSLSTYQLSLHRTNQPAQHQISWPGASGQWLISQSVLTVIGSNAG